MDSRPHRTSGAGRIPCRYPRTHRRRLFTAALVHHQQGHRPESLSRLSHRLAHRTDGGHAGAAADDRAKLCVSPANCLLRSAANLALARGHGSCWALGGSHPDKDWPTAYWAEFPRCIARPCKRNSLPPIGGPTHIARVQTLIRDTAGANAVNACDLKGGSSSQPSSIIPMYSSTDFRSAEFRRGDGDRGLWAFRRNARP